MSTRILIVNAYSARNRGDGMIVSQMVRLFSERGCAVRVMSDDPEDSERYGVLRVPPLMPSWPSADRSDSPARSLIGVAKAWARPADPSGSVEWSHVCVSAGGGYLYDDGSRSARLNLLRRLVPLRAARRAGRPVVLFNQSIGPFAARPWAALVGWELRRADLVIAREHPSLAVCRDLGIERLDLCDDIAFALQPKESGRSPRDAVGVTVVNALPGSDDRRHRAYLEVVRQGLLGALRDRDEEVLVISQVSTQPRDDDTGPAHELAQQLIQAGVRSRFVNLGDTSEQEVAAFYSTLKCVVASRLHSGILALCAGTPIVALSYLPKTEGVLTRFGVNLPVLPAGSVDAEGLAAAIRGVLENHRPLAAAISRRLPTVRADAIRGVERCLQVVGVRE